MKQSRGVCTLDLVSNNEAVLKSVYTRSLPNCDKILQSVYTRPVLYHNEAMQSVHGILNKYRSRSIRFEGIPRAPELLYQTSSLYNWEYLTQVYRFHCYKPSFNIFIPSPTPGWTPNLPTSFLMDMFSNETLVSKRNALLSWNQTRTSRVDRDPRSPAPHQLSWTRTWDVSRMHWSSFNHKFFCRNTINRKDNIAAVETNHPGSDIYQLWKYISHFSEIYEKGKISKFWYEYL